MQVQVGQGIQGRFVLSGVLSLDLYPLHFGGNDLRIGFFKLLATLRLIIIAARVFRGIAVLGAEDVAAVTVEAQQTYALAAFGTLLRLTKDARRRCRRTFCRCTNYWLGLGNGLRLAFLHIFKIETLIKPKLGAINTFDGKFECLQYSWSLNGSYFIIGEGLARLTTHIGYGRIFLGLFLLFFLVALGAVVFGDWITIVFKLVDE